MSERQPRFQHLSVRGITALVVTKVGDLLTTLYGLAAVPSLVEANPIAASVLRLAGPLGLVAMTLVGTAVVVLIVEWGANVCRRVDAADQTVTLLYVGGYVPLICLYSVATLNNVRLVLAH